LGFWRLHELGGSLSQKHSGNENVSELHRRDKWGSGGSSPFVDVPDQLLAPSKFPWRPANQVPHHKATRPKRVHDDTF